MFRFVLLAMIAVVLAQAVGGTGESSVAQPSYEFEVKPKEMTIAAVKEKDRTVFLLNGFNRGDVTIKLKGGQWPDKVSLRWQKAKGGLEHITITTDRLYAYGSHHFSGNFPFYFLDAKGQKPEAIDEQKASGKLKIVVEERAGGVEVILPTHLLVGSSKLHVHWIAWYTR